MSSASNMEKATNVIQTVVTQVVKRTGVGGVVGQAYATYLTGQLGVVGSLSDLADKVDKGEATIFDVADVALDIGAMAGGLAALITGSTGILIAVTAIGITKLVLENFPGLYEVYGELQLQRAIESGFDTAMPIDPGIEGLLLPFTKRGQDGFKDEVKDSFGVAKVTVSPIILDLDGNGVRTDGLEAGVHFDHDGNGFSELTGWVAQGDGLLVYDKNSNGIIDDGSELFGNNSKLTDGLAENGFKALQAFDDNHDGVVNKDDLGFEKLLVWKDANGNGLTDAGELMSMSEAGVKALNISYNESSSAVEHGNHYRESGTYVTTDGNVASMVDVWFDQDKSSATPTKSVVVSGEVLELPNLYGFGNMYDLHQAIMLDDGGRLKALISDFTSESDVTARRSLMKEIVLVWAGVDKLALDSRGEYISDARVLYTVEQFVGESFVQGSGTNAGLNDPGPVATIELEKIFDLVVSHYYKLLSLQTRYASFLSVINLSVDGHDGDVSALYQTLNSKYTSHEISSDDVEDFLQSIHAFGAAGDHFLGTVRALGRQGYGELAGLLETAGIARLAGTEASELLDANLYVASYLTGYGGDDVLTGGTGNDVIDGGAGNDTLYGGLGADTFRFGRGYGIDLVGSSAEAANRLDTVDLF
ncbi:hypothetical protein ACPCX5_05685, partial [Pseudomonas graminis]